MGPMVNVKCNCYFSNQIKPEGHDEDQDLVKLLPDLNGYKWTTFTIGGPPNIIRPGGETFLIRLEGNEDDKIFKRLRDNVRRHLKEIFIFIEYEDMFGNRMKRTGGILSIFGRHDEHDTHLKKY